MGYKAATHRRKQLDLLLNCNMSTDDLIDTMKIKNEEYLDKIEEDLEDLKDFELRVRRNQKIDKIIERMG